MIEYYLRYQNNYVNIWSRCLGWSLNSCRQPRRRAERSAHAPYSPAQPGGSGAASDRVYTFLSFFIIKINGVRYMYKQCWGAGLFWSRSRQKKTRKMLQNIIVSRYLKSFGWTKLLALALLYFYWLKLGTWQAQNCYNFGFFSTSSSRILSKRWIFTFNSILSLNSVGFFKFFF